MVPLQLLACGALNHAALGSVLLVDDGLERGGEATRGTGANLCDAREGAGHDVDELRQESG